MPWHKSGATHYHAQLGPPDKGRSIKGLIVSWSIARINDLWEGSMDKRKVRSLSLDAVRMAIELRYCNAPYIHITSN